jgi:hypothetical protein
MEEEMDKEVDEEVEDEEVEEKEDEEVEEKLDKEDDDEDEEEKLEQEEKLEKRRQYMAYAKTFRRPSKAETNEIRNRNRRDKRAASKVAKKDVSSSPLQAGDAKRKFRQAAINYYFVAVLGKPHENQWKERKTLSVLMHDLLIPRGSRGVVVKQLQEILNRSPNDTVYNVNQNLQRRGRKRTFVEMSDEAEVIYRSAEHQLSTTQIAVIGNDKRVAAGKNPVSWSTYQRFVLTVRSYSNHAG